MTPRHVLVALVLVVALASTPFLVSVDGDSGANAVAFEETKAIGLSSRAVQQAARSSLVIPRGEVFYSEFRYVVGYHGVTSLVADLSTGADDALGRPLAVYVTDFEGTALTLTDEGYLRMPEARVADWIPARDAYFVVGSRARIPTRNRTFVPFSTRSAARGFADRFGGRVVDWDALQREALPALGRSRDEWTAAVDRRQRRANETVAATATLRDRPVSVVVGRDAPTVAAAVERAPPNTTVRLPAGTYHVDDLTVDRSMTLRGAGRNRTTLVGDRNGSVVRATAPRVAVTGLAVAGVGPHETGEYRPSSDIDVNRSAWNYRMVLVHGYGDAGIVFDDADGSLVANVTINTSANGVVVRGSQGVVVDGLTLYGERRWQDGFLGVSVVGSQAVVQDSRFYGNKVGVFAHDASDLVVRRSTMEGMMIGVFGQYARSVLVADNDVSETWNGVYLETRASDSAVTGNRLWGNRNGVIVAGTANYVGHNRLVQNGVGVVVEGHYSLYTHNVVAYNRVGLRGLSLVPVNRVTENDVLANGRPAATPDHAVLHRWGGNYWASAPGLRTDGTGHLRRAYRPTGGVDGRVGHVPGAATLARAPGYALARLLQQRIAGLRSNGVVDPRPLAAPVRRDAVQAVRRRYDTARRGGDDDPWEFRR